MSTATTSRRSVGGVLIWSYVAVIAVVAGMGFVTVRFLTPRLFERRLTGMGFGAGGPRHNQDPFTDPAISDSLNRSLTIAAGVAALAGVLLAAGVAWWVVRTLSTRVQAMRDATHRLAAGDHSARVAEPPEAELADLAMSINTLGETLEATEQNRARLISDLAHELRNPLTTIEGTMEALIDGVMEPTPETFASVIEEADRLRRLTDDLSLLAKGQEGALQLSHDRVDVGDVVAAVADRLRSQFELKGVTLSIDLPPEAAVVGDADRLAQVFTNIVGNALTHTPQGGSVAISVRSGSEVVVQVADSGSGIPADQLVAVFDRYTRLDHTRPGTGIGLNIARTLVNAHGGTISAHSDGPGTGTTFEVVLPSA